jgi:hypothetical protein
MKRFAVATLLVAIGLPIATQGASADLLRATGVSNSSKEWVVTLTIAKTSLRTGSSMPATITIVNKTGHNVKVEDCASDETFAVGIGNAKVPYIVFSGAVACVTTLHTGTNVFHERIVATFQVCGGQGNPACGPGMPKLPTGRYRTVVSWVSATPSIPKPGTLWVTVTK